MHQEAFKPDPELVKPLLIPLLSMTNRSFKETYGHMSGAWRGKNPIQRNAIIALAHFKEASAVPTLIKLMENDARPVIRGTAAWAIGKINTEEGLVALKKAEQTEEVQEVLEEIRKGLLFYTLEK